MTRRRLLALAAGSAAGVGLGGCSDRDEAGAPANGGGEADSTVAPTTTAAPPNDIPSTSSTSPTAAPAATAASPTTSTLVPSAPAGPARFVPNGDRTRPEVALTFHTNGDPALVAELADRLRAARVPATMFVVGTWAVGAPDLLRRLVADGHELANHTWSHPALGSVDERTLAEEIVRCRDALAALSSTPVRWFRPSGIEIPTEAILAAAGAAGYAVSVGYDVDSLDFTDPGPDAVVANVAAGVDRGSIVSLHTGHADTIAALPALLRLLEARSLRPVTCSALLR